MWGDGTMHQWPSVFFLFFGLWVVVKAVVVVTGLWFLYRIAKALEEMVDMKKRAGDRRVGYGERGP